MFRFSAIFGAILVAVALSTATASADTTPLRVRFFACAAGDPTSTSVPANTPLFTSSGWASGTRGLVEAAVTKIENTFVITEPDGTTVTASPPYEPIVHNADGTWTAPFRVDLGSLQPGESLTIHWFGAITGAVEDLVPPSDSWDPAANSQPPWDGTGLKYQNHINRGPFDNGTCTVTAT